MLLTHAAVGRLNRQKMVLAVGRLVSRSRMAKNVSLTVTKTRNWLSTTKAATLLIRLINTISAPQARYLCTEAYCRLSKTTDSWVSTTDFAFRSINIRPLKASTATGF